MQYKILLPLLLVAQLAFAQGTIIPLGNDAYRILNRMEIKSGERPNYNSSLRSYNRGEAMRYVLHLDTTLSANRSPLDEQDFYYLFCENNEWLYPDAPQQTVAGKKTGYYEKIPGDTLYRFIPASQVKTSEQSPHYFKNEKPIWNHFYPTPANWFQLDKENFYLRLNPIINFKAAKSREGEENLFFNQRGVELRGGIDDRVYFYSKITDTQARFPEYVNDYIDKNRAIPGNGFYKRYESSVIDGLDGRDFLNGQAVIGLNVTKNIGLQFGHGKNFIGNGYRSMILSDFSHNYLYLKANWRIWRFHYQNIFTEMNSISAQANPGDNALPKKYMAAHYLSFDLSKNMSIGFYEAVVFRRENGFELQYLNPVILYRTVEHLLDSEDNILVGLDYKWNIKKKAQLYAQFMLDEFKFSELTAGDGWWANKYGVQVGTQIIDLFGVDHLDVRLEYNMARPYTYTHSDTLGSSYSHYNQSLAHPLGANFREGIGSIRYEPIPRLSVEARVIQAEYGTDEDGQNWGGNILLPSTSRVMEYGNEIGQGTATTTTLFGVDLSYALYHNIFIDLHYFYRKNESELANQSGVDSYFGGGFRMNVGKLRNDF